MYNKEKIPNIIGGSNYCSDVVNPMKLIKRMGIESKKKEKQSGKKQKIKKT